MHVIQVLPYLQAAGTERHAFVLSGELLKRGVSVTLLAPQGPLGSAFTATGIPHIPFPAFGFPPGPALRGVSEGLARALASHADGTPTVVHVHAGVEVLFAVRRAMKKTGRFFPTVFTVHSYFGRRPEIDYFIAAKLGGRWAHRVIAVSHADAATLRRFNRAFVAGGGDYTDRLVVVHNGMPDGRQNEAEVPRLSANRQNVREDIRRELGVPRHGLMALTVGRLTAQKGIDVLIEALACYKGPELTVFVAGDGELHGALKAHAARRGVDQMEFLGHRDDVPRLLEAADLFLLPSRMEGLSLALIEAHAAGVPCLVTDVGGNKEIVDHAITGYVTPSVDAVAFSKALAQMTEDRMALKTMGEAARIRYETYFTAAHMADQTLRVYRNVTEQGGDSINRVVG